MKIRSKLILIFFVVLTTIVMLAFFVVQNRVSAFMIARSQAMVEDNGQLAMSKIDQLLCRYKKNVKWIAGSGYIKKFFIKNNRPAIKIPSRKINFHSCPK